MYRILRVLNDYWAVEKVLQTIHTMLSLIQVPYLVDTPTKKWISICYNVHCSGVAALCSSMMTTRSKWTVSYWSCGECRSVWCTSCKAIRLHRQDSQHILGQQARRIVKPLLSSLLAKTWSWETTCKGRIVCAVLLLDRNNLSNLLKVGWKNVSLRILLTIIQCWKRSLDYVVSANIRNLYR